MFDTPIKFSTYALVLWKVESEFNQAIIAGDDATAIFAIGELVDLASDCPRSAICLRAGRTLERATAAEMPEPIRREAMRALEALALPSRTPA